MTRTGHPDLASAFADHARRSLQLDMRNLRIWPGWIEDGKQAWCGECDCNSTLIVFLPIDTAPVVTGQRAANHDGHDLGGEA